MIWKILFFTQLKIEIHWLNSIPFFIILEHNKRSLFLVLTRLTSLEVNTPTKVKNLINYRADVEDKHLISCLKLISVALLQSEVVTWKERTASFIFSEIDNIAWAEKTGIVPLVPVEIDGHGLFCIQLCILVSQSLQVRFRWFYFFTLSFGCAFNFFSDFFL